MSPSPPINTTCQCGGLLCQELRYHSLFLPIPMLHWLFLQDIHNKEITTVLLNIMEHWGKDIEVKSWRSFCNIGLLCNIHLGLQHPVVKYPTIESTVNLTVDITNNVITDYLHELNWYHNDQQIVNTYNKYSITNDNKTLIITNITKEDVGEYSVKFDGLRLYHYNRDCEQKVLQLLRHYPVLSPAAFYVSVNGELWLLNCSY